MFMLLTLINQILTQGTKMNSQAAEQQWKPLGILTSRRQDSNFAVLILNTPIRWEPSVLLPLWEEATVRLTVDGGTNRWLKWIDKNVKMPEYVSPPHMITGDMDSITKEAVNYFKRNNNSVQFVHTKDQNATDFTKALKQVRQFQDAKSIKINDVVVICDTSGRLDQIMANIQTLYLAKHILPQANIFLLASDSLTWLLFPGFHRIQIPAVLRTNQVWCGLLPVGVRCNHVTTTGLKWNIEDSSMEFGHLISTSNTYGGDPEVTIKTDDPLVWTMGLDGLLRVIEDS